jgi:hypothetical protein
MMAAAIAANIDLPGFPMTRLPRWFDFSQSNHQGNEIVNKASELSAGAGRIVGQSALIIDNFGWSPG